ncbi:MAG: prepilin-type N-terminal cleavage/methylation domain-containing protein [Armatimonadetes bacterium]|nr:prepilin-type N-terminal cleavage/methylation domain-containing protein [Armatimonadota bacterium]
MNRPRWNLRGFTFIELMTVWAIICILAAILFPVFAKAREKGRQASCLTNLLNVGAALRMYAADHWGQLPPTDNDLTPLLSPRYLPEPASLTCPSLRSEGPFGYPPQLPEQVVGVRAGYDYVYRGGRADDDMPSQGIAADRVCDVHNDGCNVLFLDGHAKWLQRKMFEPQEQAPSGPGYGGAHKPVPGALELTKLQEKLSGQGHLKPAPWLPPKARFY